MALILFMIRTKIQPLHPIDVTIYKTKKQGKINYREIYTYQNYWFVGLIYSNLSIFSSQVMIALQYIIYLSQHKMFPDQKSDRNSSKFQNLLFQAKEKTITYHNVPRLTITIIVLCFSSFYFGYCLTYFSTFEPIVSNTIFGSLATQTTFNSILKGVIPVGAILGAGTAPLLMKIFSRKFFVLFINSLAFIVEGIIQIPNVYVFLGCRIAQGIFIGNYMALIPIYINQLAPKEIVGSFGVFTQLFVVIALVVSYGIGLIMQAADVGPQLFYRLMVGLNAFFIVVQSILMFINFIPESPNSLIAKNRNEDAKQVIGLFTLPQYVEKVYKQKLLEVQVENGDVVDQKVQIKYACKAFLLGFQLPFMQQLTGINAIVTSAQTICLGVASLKNLANDIPLIINVVQVLSTIGTVFVLTRVGRRPLTLFGNLGLAIVDILIGILFVFSDWEPSGILIFVLLLIYMIIYGVSIGPSVWLYVPEIIPAKIVPLATMMNWLGCSLCVIFTPIVFQKNHESVFFFFGGITFLFFILNYFLMIETKGYSTEQISIMFNSKDKQK